MSVVRRQPRFARWQGRTLVLNHNEGLGSFIGEDFYFYLAEPNSPLFKGLSVELMETIIAGYAEQMLLVEIPNQGDTWVAEYQAKRWEEVRPEYEDE